MYGDCDPIIVFGWKENNRDQMIHQEWFYKYYSELDVYTSDVVRNYAGNAVYGVRCTLTADGRIQMTEDMRQYVIDAHRTIIERFAGNVDEAQHRYTGVGCYLALTGGFDWCHKYYIPGIGIVPYHYTVDDDIDEDERRTDDPRDNRRECNKDKRRNDGRGDGDRDRDGSGDGSGDESETDYEVSDEKIEEKQSPKRTNHPSTNQSKKRDYMQAMRHYADNYIDYNDDYSDDYSDSSEGSTPRYY